MGPGVRHDIFKFSLKYATPYTKTEVDKSCDIWCLLTWSCRRCNQYYVYGIKISWIHFQDQNTEMTIIRNNKWNRIFNQLVNRKLNSVQFIYLRGLSYKWLSVGTWGGIWKQAWGQSGSSPSRSDGSQDSQGGDWATWAVAKATQWGLSGSSPLTSDGFCDDQSGRLDAWVVARRHSKLC